MSKAISKQEVYGEDLALDELSWGELLYRLEDLSSEWTRAALEDDTEAVLSARRRIAEVALLMAQEALIHPDTPWMP
jgi:hypothetical protein